MTRTLILTVGLPRSGKSTWAKGTGLPIVNPDSIRLAIHGQAFYAPAEPLVWATARIMVRALFLAGHEIVILDATNTTRARRKEWDTKDWEVRFKDVPTLRRVCVERAIEDYREDLIPIIDRMNNQFEPLDPGELPWDSK